ncbi:MAG: 23S rRNA (uridine(2552)-2'-O)-methyltransferase RlmE [SAR86 cluster bacterium]|uniref:Ribosomal RNA large subunit methyltransferase E n=1 Tax=SAR86 cluster bacterium TaxID=2030880 RepID=A0A2A5AUF7_9GAMM|nr:MAG: 23S rRNA (uridine(2552)-2'-O)-methyltransferase RlmE [SAR86 cluster bacterium]
MARSKTSKQWLKEHFDDVYVKRSREEGYRSRASFKLLEIHQQDGLIKPGMTVVDLGAAPGGWSQVAAELVGGKGRVIASDILPMDSLAGVEFLQGDFTEEDVLNKLLASLGDQAADLVISDMAPNISGMKDIDQPRVMYLAELALDLARAVLKPGAFFLVKVFQGEGYEALRKELKISFSSVKARKPKASRARSSEIYLLAAGFRGLG